MHAPFRKSKKVLVCGAILASLFLSGSAVVYAEPGLNGAMGGGGYSDSPKSSPGGGAAGGQGWGGGGSGGGGGKSGSAASGGSYSSYPGAAPNPSSAPLGSYSNPIQKSGIPSGFPTQAPNGQWQIGTGPNGGSSGGGSSSGGNGGRNGNGVDGGDGGGTNVTVSGPTSCPAGHTRQCSSTVTGGGRNSDGPRTRTTCVCIAPPSPPSPPPPPPVSRFTISGVVFDDLNNNHARDTGEPGSDGTQTVIRLYNPTTGALVVNMGATVAANGTYTISNIPVGHYDVRAITWAPYDESYPNMGGVPGRYANYNLAQNSTLHFGIHTAAPVTTTVVPQSCPALCSGSNLVNSCTGAVIQACAFGCSSASNPHSCNVAPPPPSILTWEVAPILVKVNTPVHVTWATANTTSCTVRGTNGDGSGSNSTGTWNTLSGSATTTPILTQTIYTITCQGRAGSSPASVTESTTVSIVPVFNEQ